ncbi:MAG: hypothetical protein EA380_01070 [Phycisphaeraceae bacterium]|nr:MAG: hypothetical protein EA380_01070 [Phycisphaeraceae bacterium]
MGSFSAEALERIRREIEFVGAIEGTRLRLLGLRSEFPRCRVDLACGLRRLNVRDFWHGSVR